MLFKTKLPPSYRCREAVKPMDLILFIANNSIFLSCPFSDGWSCERSTWARQTVCRLFQCKYPGFETAYWLWAWIVKCMCTPSGNLVQVSTQVLSVSSAWFRFRLSVGLVPLCKQYSNCFPFNLENIFLEIGEYASGKAQP